MLRLGLTQPTLATSTQVQEPMFVGALVSQLGVPAVASISGVLVRHRCHPPLPPPPPQQQPLPHLFPATVLGPPQPVLPR